MIPKDGVLLRIFIGELDRHQGLPLYEWLVKNAREAGMAGATVLRGMQGFGADSRMHTSKILRLSLDLPIVIELVDTPEKIEAFIHTIDPIIKKGLMTTERIHVRFYRTRHKHKKTIGEKKNSPDKREQ